MTVRRTDPAAEPGTAQSYTLHAFAWGLLSVTVLPPESDLCPQSRIATIETDMNALNVIATGLTLGLYVPHRATITCSKPFAAAQ